MCHGQEKVSNQNNTAVLAGNDVKLQCTIQHGSRSGFLYLERGTTRINVNTIKSCSVEYDHVGYIETIVLFCLETEPTEAGRYSCVHPDSLQDASAELIVIGKIYHLFKLVSFIGTSGNTQNN